jgi:peptidoglycan hydrolase-like protein with peptidoglycan-binding domain
MWNGQWWYQRPGVAGMAVPGTSNHGMGIAIDHAIYSETTRKLSRPRAWLTWFVPVASSCGWSWEAPSENWHIRHVTGDDVTETVTEVERCRTAPVLTKGSSGSAVKLWQAIVSATVDGQFGPRTEAAVKAWQAGQTKWYGGTGLPVTGIVDGDDWWAARAVKP